VGPPQPMAFPQGMGRLIPGFDQLWRHEDWWQAPSLHSLAARLRNARHPRPRSRPSRDSRKIRSHLRRRIGRSDRHARGTHSPRYGWASRNTSRRTRQYSSRRTSRRSWNPRRFGQPASRHHHQRCSRRGNSASRHHRHPGSRHRYPARSSGNAAASFRISPGAVCAIHSRPQRSSHTSARNPAAAEVVSQLSR
jgi:hypothetical protein